MDADDVFVRAIDLSRFSAAVRDEILAILAEAAERISLRLLGGEELTDLRRDELRGVLAQIKATLGDGYAAAASVHTQQLAGLAEVEAAWAVKTTLGRGNLPPANVLRRLADNTLIHGATVAEWWSRQTGDARFRFVAAVRQGIIEGETNAQIVTRLRRDGGPLFAVRRNAEALVRTSVAAVSNAARIDGYRANPEGIIGMRQISTLDNRTTPICIAYDLATWDLDGNPIMGTTLPFAGGPPRHWNCRSTLVPITEIGERLPPGQRASMDGPVPASMTFEEWLSTKDDAFQNRVLGKGRAELWRQGRISLQQLLDQSGRPLTLAQLRAGI